MKIRRIQIANYRSIKALDLSPGDYCVLIGENNAGKSNILRAISLVLGEQWPSERMFSQEDFHNQDTTSPISIRIVFDETITETRNGKTFEIAGFELQCKAYKKRVGQKPAGTLKVDYFCVDSNGKPVTYPNQPLRRNETPTGPWLKLRVSADYRERAPFIYVDVLREYDRQAPGGRWSVLRRLFDEVNKEFASDKVLVPVELPDGGRRKMTRREAFEQTVKRAYEYLRTPAFQEIEKRLEANTIEQMGFAPSEGGISLHFQSHDPTNAYKSLELFVEQLGIASPAGEVGAGLQSAIVVGIFRTYEELKKEGAIFAIEEPEVFLHPQKARFFRDILRGLSQRGNQVFLTTHSPVFVEIAQPESMAIVRRSAVRGSWTVQPSKVQLAQNERAELRLLTEFDSQRNELFFARGVMLVEGGTEKCVMPLVCAALGIDVNRAGISIVECGGKTKLPLFVRVVRSLDIPYVVIADRDLMEIKEEWSEKRKSRERDRNTLHKRWNAELESAVEKDRLYFLDPDIEGVCGLPKSEDEKIDRALAYFTTIKRMDLPTELSQPASRLASEVSGPKDVEKEVGAEEVS